jgi:hypothetical protein
MAFALHPATVWTDVAGPLLLAFVGGAIALFWPWLQTFFRGRKFQGIIRRELEELGPHPPSPVDGKPWWEHMTKRFVHEEVFARERVSENRDFLLSLDPTVVYMVSQLWTALAKRDGAQWLNFLGELANDPKVGSDGLRQAHREWEAVVDAQPPELMALPRVREDASGSRAVEPGPALVEARLSAYQTLLGLTNAGSPGKATTLKAKQRRTRAKELTAWFYGGGGLVLSGDAHRAFYAARSRLEDEHATDEQVRTALSSLRTELKIDLGVRHPDERDVPMAPSQDQRAWGRRGRG